MDVITSSIKEYVQNTNIRKYLGEIYEIDMNPAIKHIIEQLRREVRYPTGFIDERYLIPDIYGFFVCKECHRSFLDSGIYILINKIENSLRYYLNFLDPVVFSQYILLHELAHLIVHCVLPKDDRIDYVQAESEIGSYRDFEEAYCDYCAIEGLRNGNLRVLNQSVMIPREEDFEVTLISSIPRPIPYMYFKRLVRLQEIKGRNVVDEIMQSFISGIINSQHRIAKMLWSNQMINIIKRPINFENRIGKIDISGIKLLEDVDPCTTYNLYIVKEEI